MKNKTKTKIEKIIKTITLLLNVITKVNIAQSLRLQRFSHNNSPIFVSITINAKSDLLKFSVKG